MSGRESTTREDAAENCRECAGTGRNYHYGDECEWCSGTGVKPGAPPSEIPECNWPRCKRAPNPCLAWCKCRCHNRVAKQTRGGVR